MVRQVLNVTALATLASLRAKRRAAADREILAADGDNAAIYARRASDIGRRRQLLELEILIVVAGARKRADLAETASIGQGVDALTHRESPGGVLARNILLATHFRYIGAAAFQFGNLGGPETVLCVEFSISHSNCSSLFVLRSKIQ